MPLTGVQTGLFNAQFNPAQLNTRSFNAAVLRLFPNGTAPLFGLSSQQPKKTAKPVQHGYFMKQFNFVELTVPAAITAAATTITVQAGQAAAAGIVAGQLLMVKSTREIVRVTAVAGDVLTVTRGYGRVAAAATAGADTLVGVGTAFAEGSNRPVARAIVTQYVPNYTQIFRNAWAVTDTARASLTEAGFGNVQESRKDCMLFHATDIEAATFFGQPRMVTTPGAQPEHTTQGIIDAVAQYAPANMQIAGATTNLSQLEAMLAPAFQFATDMSNAKERVAFIDSQTARVINQIARLNGMVELLPDQTTFGMNFTRFRFYKGEINLVEHPMFNGLTSMAGSMVVVDLPALAYAYLDGRDAKPENYGVDGATTPNGEDAVGGSLTSELAVELINPNSCLYITGLTQGAQG